MNRNDPIKHRTRARWLRRAALPALFAGLLGIGIVPRLEGRGALRQQTATYSDPTVAIVRPAPGADVQQLQLPADVQPYATTWIYARTDGYLAHWYADIGTHVAAGERLAAIAAPEIDAELQQARQTAATAEANYEIAKVTALRWTALLKTHSVSEEITQEDVAKMKAERAALAAARDNVVRLQELQSYERVTAPFAGVITARNIDVGALIDAGSAGGRGSALFHLAETDKVRVFIDVPQEFAADVQPGTAASLTLSQMPGQTFTGQVVRTAGAINSTSRTLRVEVDFDNGNGAIIPGVYGMIDLRIPLAHALPTLPVSALLFRPQGVQVATVDAASRVRLIPVKLGRDFGDRIAIASGLSGSERVIANPNDGIVTGEAVRVVPTGSNPS